jgi:chaperonin GroES
MATATKKKSKTKVNLQPLGDRLVVQRDESEDTTSGGIVLPDTAKDKPVRGIVLSVGHGRMLKDGTRAEMQVKEGDRILFTSYGPEELKVGDAELLLMREDDVLAIID